MSLLMDELKKAERKKAERSQRAAADVPALPAMPEPSAPPARLSRTVKPAGVPFATRWMAARAAFASAAVVAKRMWARMGGWITRSALAFGAALKTCTARWSRDPSAGRAGSRMETAARCFQQRSLRVGSLWGAGGLLVVMGGGMLMMSLHEPSSKTETATAMAATQRDRPASTGVADEAPVAPMAPADQADQVPPPSIERASAALKAGETGRARSEYQRLLDVQPEHPEALYGLAEISLQAGQHEVARDYYQRILLHHPQDLRAQVADARLQAARDAPAAEARLKALIASQPRLASAHDALGELYVAQDRWDEAQSAFLQAYRSEPDHPDILYHLAVSFDHLQQVRQALSFYRLAQQAAGVRVAHFDPHRADARIGKLTRLTEP